MHKNQKERAKKGKKEASAGQNPRLSRSVRYRRPGSGGGVFQPGGWLGCTLYAGSITEAAGAASETGWAALYTHFLPAELAFGVRLVYALFHNQPQSRGCLVCILFANKTWLPSVCTFWRRRFCSWCPPSVCTFSFSLPAAAVSS